MGSQVAGFGTYNFDFVTREAHRSPEFIALFGFAANGPLPLDEKRLQAHVHP
jgi:hypothetical protein